LSLAGVCLGNRIRKTKKHAGVPVCLPVFCRCGLWVLEECINPSVVRLLVLAGLWCIFAFAWLPVGFLHALLLLLFVPSCWFSLGLRGLGLVPLFAFVPVLFLVSLVRSCWRFFFPSVFRLVPFWFRSGSIAVRFLVVAVFLLWFWQFLSGGSALWWWRVVVWCCVLFLFPLFLLRVVGWGWLGWLFYYQIQKFPVVSFTV